MNKATAAKMDDWLAAIDSVNGREIKSGGVTSHDIAAARGMPRRKAADRLRELVELGKAQVIGYRLIERHRATVYELVKK